VGVGVAEGVGVIVGVGVDVGASTHDPRTYFPTHPDLNHSRVLQERPIFWQIFWQSVSPHTYAGIVVGTAVGIGVTVGTSVGFIFKDEPFNGPNALAEVGVIEVLTICVGSGVGTAPVRGGVGLPVIEFCCTFVENVQGTPP
jgi:hypothetical protein